VGSARTALYNYLFARHMDGTLLLRVEDTDIARSSLEFEQSIMADLKWLGLDWDEGPDSGGDHGPYRQSERAGEGIYRAAAERLLNENKAYHCFCSQERLDELKAECRARDEMPKYDRRCSAVTPEEAAERLAAGEPATIRFRVPAHRRITVDDLIHGPTAFTTDVLGDFIILRSDGGVSYNFAVVVDDIAMEISHVIRGEDHLTNTARQVLVFEALGHEPPAFAHHSLILGPDGSKLSKRHGATSVGDFRRMGYLPGAIVNYLALLSWSPEGEEKVPLAELEKQFELSRVAKSPAIFDIGKLNWLNGLYIRDLEAGELHSRLLPFIEKEPVAAAVTEGQLFIAEAAVQTSLVTLAEAPQQLDKFFTLDPLDKLEDAAEIRDEAGRKVLSMALEAAGGLPAAGELDSHNTAAALDNAKDLLKQLKTHCKEGDIPPKRLFRTLRISLTGRTSGPELPFLLAGLGRDVLSERLRAAAEFAAGK
jgi:nondiscriminating glutamyl-tRNA synthetase